MTCVAEDSGKVSYLKSIQAVPKLTIKKGASVILIQNFLHLVNAKMGQEEKLRILTASRSRLNSICSNVMRCHL